MTDEGNSKGININSGGSMDGNTQAAGRDAIQVENFINNLNLILPSYVSEEEFNATIERFRKLARTTSVIIHNDAVLEELAKIIGETRAKHIQEDIVVVNTII